MCEETFFESEWKACLWTFYCGVDFVYITNVKCEIIGKIFFVVVKICLCWLVLGDLLSNAMIIPAGFIKALWNRNIIHNWCLFMVPDIIQANIHVIGNCSLLSPMRVMCSIVCSKSVPGNDSEMIPAPLSIRLCELKETGSPLFAQFEL